MKAYIFDVEFLWGFQARIAGLSKSPPSYLFPPPTTVLGALAERLARKAKLGEKDGLKIIKDLSSDLVAISFRPMNALPISFMSLMRVFSLGIRDNINYPTTKDVYIYKSFDAPSRGNTFLSTINNEPPKVRYIIIFKESSKVTSDDIWTIKRLGSRESLVSVVSVREGIVERVSKEGHIYTATPEIEGITITPRTMNFYREYYVFPYSLDEAPSALYLKDPSKIKPYVIPMPEIFGSIRSEIYVKIDSSNFNIYHVIFNGEKEKVVGLA
ncbi:MAG: type I-A CRISPR-associated protein Cas5a [Fervidicoccaceae archaeon]